MYNIRSPRSRSDGRVAHVTWGTAETCRSALRNCWCHTANWRIAYICANAALLSLSVGSGAAGAKRTACARGGDAARFYRSRPWSEALRHETTSSDRPDATTESKKHRLTRRVDQRAKAGRDADTNTGTAEPSRKRRAGQEERSDEARERRHERRKSKDFAFSRCISRARETGLQAGTGFRAPDGSQNSPI